MKAEAWTGKVKKLCREENNNESNPKTQPAKKRAKCGSNKT
jgi:hypothetical protein